MKTIEFTNPHRRKHFEFFRRMDQPHFNITANLDITPLFPFLKQEGLSFTAAVVYCISRAANTIPQFRQRIRGERVIEHEKVSPSFTVHTEASDVFSFCYVEYQPQFRLFIEDAQRQIQRMQEAPSFEDEAGRDDYIFLSSIPWISFTSIQHAMNYSPADSVPRIAWGKYFSDQNRIWMPLAVQAHHALVDGRDMGGFFEIAQRLFSDSGAW